MALIFNVQDESVKVQAFGNWFEFKGGQVKNMSDHVGQFLTQNKAYMGFVALPENFDDLSEEEKKAEKLKAREMGINAIKMHLEGIVRNLKISLQRDLDQANIKTSSTAFASDGEIAALKKLAALKTKEKDLVKERAEEAEKLLKQVIEE